LQRISKLKPWSLKRVLVEKYRMRPMDAIFLSNFLERMLKWDPKDRPSAEEMLNDPWLKMQPEFETYIPRTHLREYKKATVPGYEWSESSESSESESDKEDAPGEENS